jgi:outer membrane murein-binding lipoprotein Lpp
MRWKISITEAIIVLAILLVLILLLIDVLSLGRQSSLEDTIVELSSQQTNLEKKITELESDLDKANQAIIAKDKEVESLNVQLDKANQAIIAKDKEVESLNVQLDKVLSRNRELEERQKIIESISIGTGLSEEVVQLIYSEATKCGYPISLPLAIVESESNFDPMVDHVNTNGTHDRGLFQINDCLDNSLWSCVFPDEPFNKSKLFDPVVNTKMGLYHLNSLYTQYEGDLHKILTAYNRGSGGMRKLVSITGSPVSSYSAKVVSRSMAWSRYD